MLRRGFFRLHSTGPAALYLLLGTVPDLTPIRSNYIDSEAIGSVCAWTVADGLQGIYRRRGWSFCGRP